MVSFIVPAYNAEKYIRACLDSILAQKGDYEVVVVDDGSSDATSEILDKYPLKDDKVKVFHQQNSGVHAARMRGLRESSGEFVAFVDSDDRIADDYLISLDFALSLDSDVVIFPIASERNGKINDNAHSFQNGCLTHREILENLQWFFVKPDLYGERDIHPSVCKMIAKREVFINAMCEVDPSIFFGEDLATSFRMVCSAEKVFFWGERPLYFYRDNGSSVMNNYKRNLLENNRKLICSLKSIPGLESNIDYRSCVARESCFFATTVFYNEFFYYSPNRFRDKHDVLVKLSSDSDLLKAIQTVDLKKAGFPAGYVLRCLQKGKLFSLSVFGLSISLLRPLLKKIIHVV